MEVWLINNTCFALFMFMSAIKKERYQFLLSSTHSKRRQLLEERYVSTGQISLPAKVV